MPLILHAPQQRQESWACQAVAISLGSLRVTFFEYATAILRICSGVYQLPSETFEKVQEWHLRQEKLHPD
jgi:hypothetical protein